MGKLARNNKIKILFYPSSGNDWENVLPKFLNEIDKFIFVDLMYNLQNIKTFKDKIQRKYEITNEEIIGNFNGKINIINTFNNSYRDIEPAYYILTISFKEKPKVLIFRKGFGQYGLNELKDNSLDVFFHRGDSMGEGGSNVYYLGNKKKNHKPLSNLFDKLTIKLKDNSLIISDGSNVSFGKLNKVYNNINKDMSKKEVINKLESSVLNINDIKLKFYDVLDKRNNHSIVWKVSKKK